jgi:lipopolysaccharide transport system permease protein
MIIPASAVITSLVDLLISLVILVILFTSFQYLPGLKVLLLPVFILMAFIAAFGAGLYLTALNVKYRDFRYIIPFIIQFGLYITPVGFSSSIVPEPYRIWYALNPMVGVIDGFRWCLLDEPLYLPGFLLSTAICLLLLGLGLWHFRRTEKSFADVI